MAYKMNGPLFFGSPNKQKKDLPKGYTEKDRKFLEEQREEPVRRSDFDEGSIQQKMFDCNQNPKTRWDNKLKKCVKK
tara:strand:+ start:39 stop:269 length:231 start_codon:yes stop_codon:yes gene_type:complete